MSDNWIEHSYTTDDRDFDGRNLTELIVGWSPNGDFYIGSRVKGESQRNLVRICTSGGASSRNPKLSKAVSDVFQALGGWGETVPDGSKDNQTDGGRT